jgi:hypothetical protein
LRAIDVGGTGHLKRRMEIYIKSSGGERERRWTHRNIYKGIDWKRWEQ